jgi:hypothetical protein
MVVITLVTDAVWRAVIENRAPASWQVSMMS